MVTASALKITFESAANLYGLPPRTHFLEHVCFRPGVESTAQIVAGHGKGKVYVSNDLGATWSETDISESLNSVPTHCFTLRSGNRIVCRRGSNEIFLVDDAWRLISKSLTSIHCWHGSWSIDEGPSGTVMYGEYGARLSTVRIFRSTDGGASWMPAFEIEGEEFSTKGGEIRHLHTCQADQTRPGRWIISSGDRKEHCRFWITDDDGDTWTELRIAAVRGIDMSEALWPRLFRHTAEWWDGNNVYWPTDDLLGRGQSAFVHFDLSTRTATVLGDLGPNEMRALVRVSDGQFVAVSESKLKIDAAQVFAVRSGGGSGLISEVQNHRQLKSGFTRSMCSRATHKGVFFSYDDGGLVDDENCRFIRWRVDLT